LNNQKRHSKSGVPINSQQEMLMRHRYIPSIFAAFSPQATRHFCPREGYHFYLLFQPELSERLLIFMARSAFRPTGIASRYRLRGPLAVGATDHKHYDTETHEGLRSEHMALGHLAQSLWNISCLLSRIDQTLS